MPGNYEMEGASSGNELQQVKIAPIALSSVSDVINARSHLMGVNFEVQTLPESFDYTNMEENQGYANCVPPVQDQGNCGSCYMPMRQLQLRLGVFVWRIISIRSYPLVKLFAVTLLVPLFVMALTTPRLQVG